MRPKSIQEQFVTFKEDELIRNIQYLNIFYFIFHINIPYFLIIGPISENQTGFYYEDCKPGVSSEASKNVDNQDRLWQISMEMINKVDF